MTLIGILEPLYTLGAHPNKTSSDLGVNTNAGPVLNIACFKGTNYWGNLVITDRFPFLMEGRIYTVDGQNVSEVVLTPPYDKAADALKKQMLETKRRSFTLLH